MRFSVASASEKRRVGIEVAAKVAGEQAGLDVWQ